MTEVSHDTIWAVISSHAARHPDAGAVRTPASVLSYREFCESAERLAAGLQSAGLERGDRVLILGPNSAETCVLWLACHRVGFTACFASRKATTRELAHAIGLLRPAAIAGERAQLDLAAQAARSSGEHRPERMIPFRREPAALSIESLLEHPPPAQGGPRPEDVAEIMFTSGTTSAPKAVSATEASLLAHWSAVSEHYRIAPDGVGYLVTPIHHQSAIRHVGLIHWLAGAEVFVADGFHPRQFWSDIHDHRVTYTCALDAMWRILTTLPPSAQETGHRLSLVVGLGDPVLGDECEQRFGFEVNEVYGSTETGAPVMARMGMTRQERARFRHAIPGARFCGWPLPGNDIRLAEIESGVGEIVVRSTLAAPAYVDGPSYGDDGWFYSSDRGIVGPDGALYFAGRAQEIIRRAGENISAVEIESVMNEHPDVLYAAVVGVPDEVRDEEVKAFVVVRGDGVDPHDLRGWLAEQLAAHKLPRYIDVCADLPMTESGKINKPELLRGNHVTINRYDAAHLAGPR